MKKAKEINDSGLYGIIIEMNSATLWNALASELGVQNTIYQTVHLRDQEVSEEHVRRTALEAWERCDDKDKVNFVFVSSWHLYENGWYALLHINHGFKPYLQKLETIHFTMPMDIGLIPSDVSYHELQKASVDLLHCLVKDEWPVDSHITDMTKHDGLLFIDNAGFIGTNYSLLIGALDNSDHDYPLVFDKSGAILFKDFIEGCDELVVGYNPSEDRHVRMYDETCALSKKAILMSMDFYDLSLYENIRHATDKGHNVIVCKDEYADKGRDLLERWSSGRTKIRFIDWDNINKYEEDVRDRKQCDERFFSRFRQGTFRPGPIGAFERRIGQLFYCAI